MDATVLDGAFTTHAWQCKLSIASFLFKHDRRRRRCPQPSVPTFVTLTPSFRVHPTVLDDRPHSQRHHTASHPFIHSLLLLKTYIPVNWPTTQRSDVAIAPRFTHLPDRRPACNNMPGRCRFDIFLPPSVPPPFRTRLTFLDVAINPFQPITQFLQSYRYSYSYNTLISFVLLTFLRSRHSSPLHLRLSHIFRYDHTSSTR
jgi:hypothetical protein